MKKIDFSISLLETHFLYPNEEVRVVLYDGKVLRGIIAGYFYTDDVAKLHVEKWHLMPKKSHSPDGTDAFDSALGCFIYTHQILSVQFIYSHILLTNTKKS